MKLLTVFSLMLLVGMCSQAVLAQCCCSGSEVKITDGAGYVLPASEVRIKEISDASGNRLSVDKNEAAFRFPVGCGNGKEALLIEYMGVEMRIRFKLYGEFGSPKGEVVFIPGDYVAEIEKEREDEGARKLVFRQATAEEMKELEPPAVSDAAPDQTANPL